MIKSIMFFVGQKRKVVMIMIKYIKQELNLSPDLKKKINFAKKYSSLDINTQKGALIKLEPTNIAYVEPHKIIINNITFLFFNGIDDFYINDLHEKHHLSELQTFFIKAKTQS